MEYRAFLDEMFGRISFSQECREAVLAFEAQMDEELQQYLTATVTYYMYPEACDINDVMKKLELMAEAKQLNVYRVVAAFLLRCLPILRERYAEAQLEEELFWGICDDIRCKMAECKENQGAWGVVCGTWYGNMLGMRCFALGRFEYILETYQGDGVYFPNGYILRKGDKYVGFHIPSSGVPLTDEVRLDSYRQAEKFFKQYFPDGPVILSTDSWIIFPAQYRFLPEKSNLRRFMDDFYIATMREQEFKDAWRLFGASSQLPVEQWEEKTSMQRAYKKWVLDGHMTGRARGFIIMENGENVTHTKKW